MEKYEKYDWLTEFDTADETITMVFSDRVKAVVNFKLRTITEFKEDRITYSFDYEEDYSLIEFEQLLLNMATAAKTLEEFGNGNRQ